MDNELQQPQTGVPLGEWQENLEKNRIPVKKMPISLWRENLTKGKFVECRKAIENEQLSDEELPLAEELLNEYLAENEDPEENAKTKLNEYVTTYSLEAQINDAVAQLHQDIDEALLVIDKYETDLERGTYWGRLPFYDPIKRIGSGKEFKAKMKKIDDTFGNLPQELQKDLYKMINKNDKLTPAGAKKLIAADSLMVGGVGLLGAGMLTGGVGFFAGSIAASLASIGGQIHGEINKLSSLKDGKELKKRLRALKDQLSQKANPLAVKHFIDSLGTSGALTKAEKLAGVN